MWTQNRYMQPIYCPCRLRKAPTSFKTLNDLFKLVSLRNVNVFRQKMCRDGTASLVYNGANRRTTKTKQCRECCIFYAACMIANLHKVTATLCSTPTGCLKHVISLPMYEHNSAQRISNVPFVIRRFSFHHSFPNSPFMTASHQCLFQGLYHTEHTTGTREFAISRAMTLILSMIAKQRFNVQQTRQTPSLL